MGDDKGNPDELLSGGPDAAVELTEAEMDQVAGGDAKKTSITFGVQKDKMASANKNSDAVKALL